MSNNLIHPNCVLVDEVLEKLRVALVECAAQAHYFLCHSINGHPSMVDDGTCQAKHCVMVRDALAACAKGEE